MKASIFTIILCIFATFTSANNIVTEQDSTVFASIKSTYTTIYRDKNTGWYMVEKNKKWGYVDTNGDLVVEPRYDLACGFHENLAAVQRNGRWGFINMRGEEVISPTYENTGYFKNGLAISEFGGKWGWINNKGEVVVPFAYDWVMEFRNDGRAAVKQDNKWGWIDRQGKIIIPIQFDNVDGYEEGLVRVTKGSSTYYIDKSGRCVEDCYHERDNYNSTASNN